MVNKLKLKLLLMQLIHKEKKYILAIRKTEKIFFKLKSNGLKLIIEEKTPEKI